MIYPHQKHEIIQTVLSEIGDNPDNPWKDMSIDTLKFKWFVSARMEEGFRLSTEGETAFRYANLQYYDFPINLSWLVKLSATAWAKFGSLLNKTIHCPFFIGPHDKDVMRKPYVRVYDHKVAMMITLYGSISEYVEANK